MVLTQAKHHPHSACSKSSQLYAMLYGVSGFDAFATDHCNTRHCTALNFTELHCTTLHYTALHSLDTTLTYNAVHWIVSHASLHYTVLYSLLLSEPTLQTSCQHPSPRLGPRLCRALQFSVDMENVTSTTSEHACVNFQE